MQVNQSDLLRAERVLANYKNPEYMRRATQIFYSGAKMLERPLRSSAPYNRWPDPVGSQRKRNRGALRKSVRTRKNKITFGELAAATTGATKRGAPHEYLVARGTRPHSLSPKRAGKKPYVYFVPRAGQVKRRPSKVYSWRQDSYHAGQEAVTMRGADVNHPGAKATDFVGNVQPMYEGRIVSFIERNLTNLGPSPLYKGALVK